MKHIDIKLVFVVLAIFFMCLLLLARINSRIILSSNIKNIPKEITYQEIISSSPVFLPSISVSPSIIPAATPNISLAINLAVPFVPQAPHGNWDLPFQEACEETSLILADAFYKNKNPTADQVRDEILKLVEWQQKRFGYYFHTTVQEDAVMMKEYFGFKKVEIINNPTHEQIASHLRAGRLIIAPLAGRLLNNPYYRGEGPIFHELVIKGITKDGDYITNDVGTRRGRNFVYQKDVLMNALHDVPVGGDSWWGQNPAEDIKNGPKRVLIVYPNL